MILHEWSELRSSWRPPVVWHRQVMMALADNAGEARWGTRWSVKRCPKCWRMGDWRSRLIRANLDLWRRADYTRLMQGKTARNTNKFSTRDSLELRPSTTITGDIIWQRTRGDQGFSADTDYQCAASDSRRQPRQRRCNPTQPLTAPLKHNRHNVVSQQFTTSWKKVVKM